MTHRSTTTQLPTFTRLPLRSSAVRQALHQHDQAHVEGTAGAVHPAGRTVCRPQPPDRLVEILTSIVELLGDLCAENRDDVSRTLPDTQSLRAASGQLLRLADVLDESACRRRVAVPNVPQRAAVDPSTSGDRGEWVEAGR
jgi:hypothetical protein